jgi:chemotaxis protein CheC
MLEPNQENKEKDTNYIYQMDALKEVGNIAAAHAATALSKLLAQDILIDVSESHLYLVEELPNGIDLKAEKVAVVYLDVHEEERGIMLFIFPYDKAVRLSNMFLGTQESAQGEIGEDARSAICEIGNICACAYLNAISKFLEVTLVPSPPGLAIDMLHAIMEFPASIIGQRSEYAIVIETKFIFGGEAFPGVILYMIDPPSQELIMKRFGVSTNMKG